MSNIPENQIGDWLKKLERESWQLELLVSAFTIFLLFIAMDSFDDFLVGLQYQYNISAGGLSLVYIFFILLQGSLQALTACLIGHLMLRGFWIGTIGLRSVQSSIDFNKLNYTTFFTERLKKKVISLDQLVIKLDEICSVIFAFAFLVISMLIAFGLYLLMLGGVAILLNTISEIAGPAFDKAIGFTAVGIFIILMFSGLIYMIDYLTLGFFKKIKWIRKIYYPFYRFYNVITLSVLSRSIYYYLISKFTKRRIRVIYALVGTLLLTYMLLDFDQHRYFPDSSNDYFMSANYYDDVRSKDEYVEKVSISSHYIDKPHFRLFLRYKPADNPIIQSHCPDFKPIKDDGLNWKFSTKIEGGNFVINGRDNSGENFETLLACQSAIYQVSVNDSVYQELKYYFYVHPAKDQKGLLTTIPTEAFLNGENVLDLMKVEIDSTKSDSTRFIKTNFARVPFWYKKW